VPTPEDLLAGSELGLAVYRRVRAQLDPLGRYDVRVGKSQIAFRRARGFAYLWLPGQYLRHPDAEVVLSLALGRELTSPRFKQVVQPAPRQWMHHLEVRDVADLDDEVGDWVAEAFQGAG
jgi:hypothetical protein